MAWDASTISAVAALFVSAIALVIAAAQALQQYFITGQLIRLCDSVVYGPLEGQGHRMWQWTQFRFRVLYTMPLISLDSNMWPSVPPHIKSYAVGAKEFPLLALPPPPLPQDGPSDSPFSAVVVRVDTRRQPRVLDIVPSNSHSRRRRPNLRDRRGGVEHGGEHDNSSTWDDSSISNQSSFDSGSRSSRSSATSEEESSKHWVVRVWASCRSWVTWRTWKTKRAIKRTWKEMHTWWDEGEIPAGTRNAWWLWACVVRFRWKVWRLWHRGEEDDSASAASSATRASKMVPGRANVGEAAWVSFCRAVHAHCGDSMRIDFSEHDADRCPADLTTVPMQVSMRDVIVMGLTTGMEVTDCSFGDKSVAMQGEIGTITTAQHPVLGSLLHFTSRHVDMPRASAFGVLRYNGNSRGHISPDWIARTWDVCTVAGKPYHSGARRTARRLDSRWLQDQDAGRGALDVTIAGDDDDGRRRKKASKHRNKGKRSKHGGKGADAAEKWGHEDKDDSWPPEHKDQDGEWSIWGFSKDMPPASLPGCKEEGSGPDPERSHRPPPEAGPSRVQRRRTTVEDVSDDEGNEDREKEHLPEDGPVLVPTPMPRMPTPLLIRRPDDDDRAKVAQARQEERSERTRAIHRDRELVEESVRKGIMPSPYTNTMPTSHGSKQLLLTYAPHNPDDDMPSLSREEREAHERETKRHEERLQRDADRDKRNLTGNRVALLTRMDMFWFCQMDIFQGFWATPWAQITHMPMQASLTGGVIVLLECLLGFLPGDALSYVDRRHASFGSFQRTTAAWLYPGQRTYPAYALNARGGVIAPGIYRVVRVPAFDGDVGKEKEKEKGGQENTSPRHPITPIPALELLYSYHWQVQQEAHDRSRYGEELNVELMRIDSWLSFVGRLPAIVDGPSRLLDHTPALVDLLRKEFWLDFQYMDLNARDGGRQAVQSLAANVLDWMVDEGLTDAEQLYLTVACLRGFKVGQCIVAGAETGILRDILLKDVQVHLV